MATPLLYSLLDDPGCHLVRIMLAMKGVKFMVTWIDQSESLRVGHLESPLPIFSLDPDPDELISGAVLNHVGVIVEFIDEAYTSPQVMHGCASCPPKERAELRMFMQVMLTGCFPLIDSIKNESDARKKEAAAAELRDYFDVCVRIINNGVRKGYAHAMGNEITMWDLIIVVIGWRMNLLDGTKAALSPKDKSILTAFLQRMYKKSEFYLGTSRTEMALAPPGVLGLDAGSSYTLVGELLGG